MNDTRSKPFREVYPCAKAGDIFIVQLGVYSGERVVYLGYACGSSGRFTFNGSVQLALEPHAVSPENSIPTVLRKRSLKLLLC